LLQIVVEDNGPGIPADLEQKIFEPFFTTKEVGTGTGLGLSIAHSIMTEHNGKIFHQPSPLGGAAFTLEFPLVTVEPPPEIESNGQMPLTPRSTSPTAAAQILVLDDEKSIAELLSEMLSVLGYKPTICLNPATALELVNSQSFDLIISDFRMPVMNGQEFHNRVQKKDAALAKRIIFLTGDVVSEDTHAFLESNGNPHLAKPFQLATLEQAVADALAKFDRNRPVSTDTKITAA
jgi:CheY-like chemotaxis protein